jgi:hypothetical protein
MIKGDKTDIGELLSLSQVQRQGGEIQSANETLKDAAKILDAEKKPDSQRVYLAEEQARCGDFTGAIDTLQKLTQPEDKLRLEKTLSVEQARQGKLQAALKILPSEALTDENLDIIGAVALGSFDKIELFPALRSAAQE